MFEFLSNFDFPSVFLGYFLCMLFDVIFAFTNLMLEKSLQLRKQNRKDDKK